MGDGGSGLTVGRVMDADLGLTISRVVGRPTLPAQCFAVGGDGEPVVGVAGDVVDFAVPGPGVAAAALAVAVSDQDASALGALGFAASWAAAAFLTPVALRLTADGVSAR